MMSQVTSLYTIAWSLIPLLKGLEAAPIKLSHIFPPWDASDYEPWIASPWEDYQASPETWIFRPVVPPRRSMNVKNSWFRQRFPRVDISLHQLNTGTGNQDATVHHESHVSSSSSSSYSDSTGKRRYSSKTGSENTRFSGRKKGDTGKITGKLSRKVSGGFKRFKQDDATGAGGYGVVGQMESAVNADVAGQHGQASLYNAQGFHRERSYTARPNTVQ
ncbi:uncharacterized protein LOC135383783 [Ornithodoros turicata]|uniref:uncharacterized protein LOC135383783 n=1 Tax=Ornithodoros turicata TaxID=34597 RepID=UPI003139A7BD